jgi:hypothetical protein
VNIYLNKRTFFWSLVFISLIFPLFVQIGANAQAMPGDATPPDQKTTQVGLPSPNQRSSPSSSTQTNSSLQNNSIVVTQQSVTTQVQPATTVRSGGFDWFIAVVILACLSFGYFYWKKQKGKSALKTVEKKLK